ncbi:MAG: polyphosphate polymerase domain-containing protein [Gemmataceae bacterium]|nr:polyphosphate polymerase domain-containing protein [Gemmataceae bacterium]
MTDDTANTSCHSKGESGGPAAPGDIRETAEEVFARHAHPSLSPSLWKDREEPAFEIKFQVDEAKARTLAAWAQEHLQLDPHADPARDNSYRVHGMYFDTPALDVFHRSPGYKKKKYRLRRYGDDVMLFLEQKRKSAGRVAKRRIQIAEAELERLRELPTDLEWAGRWFHRRITLRKLEPSCCISYQRQAYFGQNAEGPLRLTLDRHVRCQPADRWSVVEVPEGLPRLTDQVLLELKFRRHLPALFKTLMQDFSLTPGPLSKYRLSIQALGRDTKNGRLNHGAA